MTNTKFTLIRILGFIILILFSGCTNRVGEGDLDLLIQTMEIQLTENSAAEPDHTQTPLTTNSAPATEELFPTETPERVTPSLTPEPTQTAVLATDIPTVYSVVQPGTVDIPVLLYHHISDDLTGRYYVPIQDFYDQMVFLKESGYKTITISEMVDVIRFGGEIPAKSIVITFDDGAIDVYENAFPIMQELGFIGTFYIVANRFNADGFAGVDELSELIEAGWEIGSHSYSHKNLTLDHTVARHEILDSRVRIGEQLGIEVQSFAYPFGMIDPYIVEKTFDYGYTNAVGLGTSWKHGASSVFYINRIEVRDTYSIEYLESILP